MFTTLRDAFKVEDLRKRIFYTLIMLAVIRIGANITVPGVDTKLMLAQFDSFAEQTGSSTMMGMLDAFSGGAFKQMALFALGIIPYINASIIMNLLTIAIPALEEMQKEGQEGKKKIAKITRYGTVVLALIQAIATTITINNYGAFGSNKGFTTYLISVFALTAGTAFLMWIGERITENGIGNGISLIIVINILSGLRNGATALWDLFSTGNAQEIGKAVAILVVFLCMIIGIVIIQLGERRISVQYAKRVQGRKVYGGQSTHIPVKVNMAGVIPVIFASSLLQFPAVVTSFFQNVPQWWQDVLNWISYSNIRGNYGVGALVYVLLVIGFAYFYTAIIFNPFEVANNLKKNGGFILGIRPGRPTVDYLTSVLNRMVFIGGCILATIALAPILLSFATNVAINFGGTSLIIVVGVALETVKQIESQLVMRHYKGFLNS